MLMKRIATAIILSTFTIVFPTVANGLETARVSLTSGKYDQAYSQAQLIGDIEGLLIAAEALKTKRRCPR